MPGSLDKERNIKITAKRGNEDYSQTIKMTFKNEETANSSIAAYWARQKIAEIYKSNRFVPNGKLEEEVTALGLRYSIMSEYTSFVAIDDAIRNTSGKTETVEVPVYEVEGKDYAGVYGAAESASASRKLYAPGIGFQGSSSNMGSVNDSLKGAPAPAGVMETLGNMFGGAKSESMSASPKMAATFTDSAESSNSDKIQSTRKEGVSESPNVQNIVILLGIASLIAGLAYLAIRFFKRAKKEKK